MISTLCLSGGGTKCISFISVLIYLENENFFKIKDIKKFVGTSGGAILGFLLSLKYKLEELKEFVLKFDFTKFEPEVDCDNFLNNYGIDNGNKIISAISTFLFEKYKLKDITFLELYQLTNIELNIIVTNYTKSIAENLCFKNNPNMSVILAVRMSISIPIIFTPVLYNGNYYVDGALTSNFPLEYCLPKETFGLVIITNQDNELSGFIKYIRGISNVLMRTISLSNFNKSLLAEYKFIELSPKLDSAVDFSIKKDIIEKLLNDGTEDAKQYLSNFIANKVAKELIDDIINNVLKNIKK